MMTRSPSIYSPELLDETDRVYKQIPHGQVTLDVLEELGGPNRLHGRSPHVMNMQRAELMKSYMLSNGVDYANSGGSLLKLMKRDSNRNIGFTLQDQQTKQKVVFTSSGSPDYKLTCTIQGSQNPLMEVPTRYLPFVENAITKFVNEEKQAVLAADLTKSTGQRSVHKLAAAL